jgi:threonine dehydrogenase-like Zn-dependent dehydrogenase
MPGNRAIILTNKTDPVSWTIEDRDIPEAVPGTIVIQVLYSILVQYSKEHVTGKSYLNWPTPAVPGGNGIGRVYSIGADTTVFQPGDLVLVEPTITARDDRASQLLLGFWEGLTPGSSKLMKEIWRDGLWQQYCRLPVENVFKLDELRLTKELGYRIEDLQLIQSCAISYGGLGDSGVKAGDTIIVSPATGRFGGATVLTALAMGANVVAAGRRQDALDELVVAMGHGASLKTVRLSGNVEEDTAAFEHAVGPKGADVIMDWSPPQLTGTTPAYLTAGINVLKFKGTLCFMGGISGNISIPYFLVVSKNLILRGRFMNEKEQIEQCIKLAESGKLLLGQKCGQNTVINFSLERFIEALDEAALQPGWKAAVSLAPQM